MKKRDQLRHGRHGYALCDRCAYAAALGFALISADDPPVWDTLPRMGLYLFYFNDLPEGDGGDEGIRTLDELLAHTPLAGERLRPLGHVSVGGFMAKWRWLQGKDASFFKKNALGFVGRV